MNRTNLILILIIVFFSELCFAQENQNSLVLQTILETYYKNEKPVYKGRSQLLYLYCNQANNNEELIEAIKDKKLPQEFINEIRFRFLF